MLSITPALPTLAVSRRARLKRLPILAKVTPIHREDSLMINSPATTQPRKNRTLEVTHRPQLNPSCGPLLGCPIIVVLDIQQLPLEPMANEFGKLIAQHRTALRLTLRKFADAAEMDAGNLSRIERGRVAPPQNSAVLGRMARALHITTTEAVQEFKDLAAIHAGHIPPALMSDEELLASLPLLLCTHSKKRLTPEKIERLIELIRAS